MSHSHLILEERLVIELFVHRGMSCREIATHLGPHHTTVSREVRRNSSKSVGVYSNTLKLTPTVPAAIVSMALSAPWRLKRFNMLDWVSTPNGKDQVREGRLSQTPPGAGRP
jgi:hypothetical protein